MASRARGGGGSVSKQKLKLVCSATKEEFSLAHERISVGRAKQCTICLNDPLVSGKHAEIINGFVSDSGSTNGTLLNGKPLPKNKKVCLVANDKVLVGDTELKVERGEAVKSNNDLNRSKRFQAGVYNRAGDNKKDGTASSTSSSSSSSSKADEESKELTEEEAAEAKMSVPELMESEFKKIIGHDSIKAQLRQFYKKVQLDSIRVKNGKDKDAKRLFHMIFFGPPGTGKTTMANVVAKMMVKMKLISTDKVVFVNNPLELLAGYVGQTPAKVDAKVEEARGGVLFVDEAYSILKEASHKEGSNSASFAREAIDTIMKHLDPPSCVFIFAGYEKPMNEFLRVNEGLSRRIPYRFHFEPYTIEQLTAIFKVMCDAKGEILAAGVVDNVPRLLQSLPEQQLLTQNAGLVANWLSFAQMERDDRLDIHEAVNNPDLASTLEVKDMEAGLDKVKTAA